MMENFRDWKNGPRGFPVAGILRCFCVSLLAVAVVHGAEPKHVRLLAVGNSFSQNATRFLPGIVEAAGDRLTFQTISIGGCTVQRHWTNALAFQNGSMHPEAVTWKKLTEEKWDFVTIQQQSMLSCRAESFRPFAQNLRDYIKTKVPGAEVVLHGTWAYRADDPIFKEGFSAQVMNSQIRAAYSVIAGELGCRIIPVGDSFENARRDAAWGGVFPDPQFDAKLAEFPKLPDQSRSLHVGWSWTTGKDGKQGLKYDGHHANAAGEFLGAAVWYEFLFDRSVVGNKFRPKGMSDADSEILQRIAHETVRGGVK